jgi:hypothetical protein
VGEEQEIKKKVMKIYASIEDKKISKGQRRIRTQRYFYQPNDLVKFEGTICRVIGTMNKGKSVKLDNKKNPNPKNLQPYKFCKGLVVI